jgi:hypothetical protein
MKKSSTKCNMEIVAIRDNTYIFNDEGINITLTISQEEDKLDFRITVDGVLRSFKTQLNLEQLRSHSLFQMFDNLKEIIDTIDSCIKSFEFQLIYRDRCQLTIFNVFIKKYMSATIDFEEEEGDNNLTMHRLIEMVVKLQNDLNKKTQEINDLKSNISNLNDSFLQFKQEMQCLTGTQVTSKILRSDEHVIMKQWLGKDFKLRLLFSSYNDGDSADNFHTNCDWKKNTLTLIETNTGRRFGGFSKQPWNGVKGYVQGDGEDFLFTLDNRKKLLNTDTRSSIYCHSGYLTIFGYGHDICIKEGFLTNHSSYSILTSYGAGEDIKDPKTYLAGGNYFQVKMMEVFQVCFDN